MNRAFFLLVVVSGCLYGDPINQRPALDIVRTSGGDAVYRGSQVGLEAIANDPDSDLVFFQWRAYACTDAAAEPRACDAVPFHTAVLETTSFMVPFLRVDEAVPVKQVLVLLEGQDELGATAKPIQQLVITIDNHAPNLEVRKTSRYGYVENASIGLFAELWDPDDAFDTPGMIAPLTIDWQVFTPMTQPDYDFTDPLVPVPQDPEQPDHLHLGKIFTPKGVGDWEIVVTGTDPLGATAEKTIAITVVADGAPCLSQYSPITAPAGTSLPITEPTLFQVHVVEDDLDVYPPVPDDLVLGTTTFAWSILPPGASTRQALAVTTNTVALDPGNYAPGDIVELRVEIQDRKQTPVNCPAGDATCSVISNPSCIQRLTWRVEVR